MSLVLQNRLQLLLGYLAFAGALGWAAVHLSSAIVREGVHIMPVLESAEPSEPSRVERFLLAELAAQKAPQVPVPRVVHARELPQVTAPVLAAVLDEAESVAAEPILIQPKAKRETAARPPKPAVKRKAKPGKLPEAVLADALLGLQALPAKPKSLNVARVETTRDITYRNFNITLASTN